MAWLRDLWLRFWGRKTAPEAQPPPAPTVEELIAARDAQWNALLARYDVRPRGDGRPRKFSPLLIDNEERKCFRMREENGVRIRAPVPCGGWPPSGEDASSSPSSSDDSWPDSYE